MKKGSYFFVLLSVVGLTFAGCREVKENQPNSKLERAAEEVEDAGERAVEEVKGAADDVKEELNGDTDDN